MLTDPTTFYRGGLAVESYELFVADARLAGDIDFYLSLARAHAGPVLDLGAGAGRVLLPLAQAGVTVTGVDNAEAMLAVARARVDAALPHVRKHVTLIHSSMETFVPDREYGLVLIPARSFQHLIEPVLQRAALRQAWSALRPGGLLVVDMFDPALEMVVGTPDLPPPREVADPTSGRRFRRTCIKRWTDPHKQVVGERLLVEELDPSGCVLASQETAWSLRWSTRQEMAWLFELSGFEIVAQYSDFKGSAPRYGGEQLWVVRRPT